MFSPTGRDEASRVPADVTFPSPLLRRGAWGEELRLAPLPDRWHGVGILPSPPAPLPSGERGDRGRPWVANCTTARAECNRTMNLLIVDDETVLRRTLRTALESMGHRVAEAPSGETALAHLSRQQADLAFLDLRLGRESGLDVLTTLLQAAPGLAVVVMTAYATVATAVE